jgi:hypothetical protein
VKGVAKETGNEALGAVSSIILVHGVLTRVGVNYKTGFGLVGVVAPYTITHFQTTGNYSAIAILHTS